MRTPFLCIVLTLLLVTCHAATAWGVNRVLFQFYNFRQALGLSYDFDSFAGKQGGVSNETTRNSPRESYGFGVNYAVYSPNLLRGRLSLDLEARQEFDSGSRGSADSSDFRFNYDITGVLFRLRPYTVEFFFDSNLYRVSPAFSRNYDLQTDQVGATLHLRNRFLPTSIAYSRYVSESSGLAQDRRNTMDSLMFQTTHSTRGNLSHTSAAIQFNNAFDETISGNAERKDHDSVSGTFTHRLNIPSNVDLQRALTSSYRFAKEAGENPGELSTWSETLDWAFGKSLKMLLDGEFDSTVSTSETRHESRQLARLEHRLFRSLTTKARFGARQTRFDTGEEDAVATGLDLGYNKKLPSDSTIFLGYAFDYGITDSNRGGDTLFVRDERLNVGPVETSNYLGRTDVITTTIVVWNASRTKTFIEGVDYAPVQDGRRVRLRIEPGSGINFGDAVSIDYSVRTNPRIKYENVTHGLSATLDLRKVYKLAASWSYGTQEKLAGSDDVVPLSPTTVYSVQLERIAPYYRVGTNYLNFDSNFAAYQKFEGYWKYNREYDLHTISASVNDIVTVHKRTGSGNTISQGGTTNEFLTSAYFRRSLSDRLSMSLTGMYQNSTGRSSDQHLISSWFQTRLLAAKFESDLNFKVDWRFFNSSYQRDFSLRLNLKRYF